MKTVYKKPEVETVKLNLSDRVMLDYDISKTTGTINAKQENLGEDIWNDDIWNDDIWSYIDSDSK